MEARGGEGAHPAELGKEVLGGRGHGRELGERRRHLEKRDEVLNLDLDAVLDVGILGKMVRNGLEASTVATVDGTDGVDGCGRHDSVVPFFPSLL